MKLLGLIGGVSPEATAIYYRLLTAAAREKLGPLHSANILLYALDYGVMIEHYDNEDWDAFTAEVVKGAKRLAAAGADALVISSNTTHVAADAIIVETGLPLVHMLDVLAGAMTAQSVKRPLLLGTPAVMSGEHYLNDLGKRYDGAVQSPSQQDQAVIGRIILGELVLGNVLEASRRELQDIIACYDCDGVVLGCTELCMILSQQYCDIPVFDTTALHARAAADYAFTEG